MKTSVIDKRVLVSRAIELMWDTMRRNNPLPVPPSLPAGLPPGLIPFAVAKGSLGSMAAALSSWEYLSLLSSDEAQRVRLSLVKAQMSVTAMRRELSWLFSAFTKAGIPVILFKGHDLLLTCYRDDRLRPVTDADLLVHEDDYPKITEILAGHGYHTPGGEKTSTWSRGSFIIDVHRRFVNDVRNPMSIHVPHIPTADLFAGARMVRREGIEYLSPNPGHSLIITAIHALTHSYQMDTWFADAGALIIAENDAAFAHSCRDLAAQYRLDRVLGYLFWGMDELLGFPLEINLLRQGPPPVIVRRLIAAAFRDTRYLFFGDILLGLSIDTNRKKFYYFREMAFPHRDVVAREYGIGAGGKFRPYLIRSMRLIGSGIRILRSGRR